MAIDRITYNGYTFPFAKLTSESEDLYGEDGRTLVGTRYRFTVSGLVSATTEALFAAAVNTMRCRLHPPRGAFKAEWSADGLTFSTLYDVSTANDINYGPRPTPLRLERINGGKSALYSWSVECEVKECFTSCAVTPNGTTNVLSLSRSYSHRVSENGMTSRTISGRMLVTSTEALAGRPADFWRWVTVPPLPNGFKREEQSFTQSADGRTLEYSITDVEVNHTLPRPITKGTATWVSRTRQIGAMADYALSGRFEAPPFVSKATILQKIGELVVSRFDVDKTIWSLLQIEEELYESNSVSFSFAGSWASEGDATDPFTLLNKNFGALPPGSTGQAQFVGPYGGDGETYDSGVKAGTPRLYDACQGGLAGDSRVTTDGGGTPGIELNTRTPPTPATPNQQATTPEHDAAPYTGYSETYSWETDFKRVTFSPKVDGQPLVIQQTGLPTVRFIQTGYATREGAAGKTPKKAKFLYSGTDLAQLTWQSDTPTNVEPLANGRIRATVRWQYIALMKDSPTYVDPLDVKFPNDPRTTTTGGDVGTAA